MEKWEKQFSDSQETDSYGAEVNAAQLELQALNNDVITGSNPLATANPGRRFALWHEQLGILIWLIDPVLVSYCCSATPSLSAAVAAQFGWREGEIIAFCVILSHPIYLLSYVNVAWQESSRLPTALSPRPPHTSQNKLTCMLSKIILMHFMTRREGNNIEIWK